MSLRRRLLVPICALAALLAACAEPSSSSEPAGSQPPQAASSATPDPAALAAYADAICPIFDAILAVDPRIGEVRAAASDGGDMSDQATEMAALGDELLDLLTDLEAVPQWDPGAALRHHLITSLHAIRTALLHVGRDPVARDAAENITAMPFIATDALDRAMSSATRDGLTCAPRATIPASQQAFAARAHAAGTMASRA